MDNLNLPPTAKRVYGNTRKRVNKEIKSNIAKQIKEYSQKSPQEIDDRIDELDREWDTERTLETNFAIIVLLSSFLGFIGDKRWFTLGGIAAGFLLQHALQGWCPPLPIIRNLGIRTADEIFKEKNLLKKVKKWKEVKPQTN